MHNARGFERDEDDDPGRSFPYRSQMLRDDEDDHMRAERWDALDPVAQESMLMDDAQDEGSLTAPESFSDQLQTNEDGESYFSAHVTGIGGDAYDGRYPSFMQYEDEGSPQQTEESQEEFELIGPEVDFVDRHRDEVISVHSTDSASDGDDCQAAGGVVDGYHAVLIGQKRSLSSVAMFSLIQEQLEMEDPENPNILSRVPVGVKKNVCFIINMLMLKSPKDLLSDNNGVWTYDRGTVKAKVDNVKVERRSFFNPAFPAFRRVILSVPDFGVALLQYYFNSGEETNFAVPPHRQKIASSSPYKRKFASSIAATKASVRQGDKSNAVIRLDAIKAAGGLENIASTAQVPTECSIRMARYRMRFEDTHHELERLAATCFAERNTPSCFIRDVRIAPTEIIMLATNNGLHDLERFCAAPKGAVMSIDTTFDMVAQHLVTLVVTRNLLLRTSRSGVHPVILCAAFIHTKKDEDSYGTMASMLLCANPALAFVGLIGTDGDIIFHLSRHILCQIHLVDNILRKIKEFRLEAKKGDILDAIVGKRIGDGRTEALIDMTGADFEERATVLMAEWADLGDEGAKFAEYFRDNKLHLLRDLYSVELREMAGSSLRAYDQNGSESMNALLKQGAKAKMSRSEMVEHCRNFFGAQEEAARESLLRLGKWRLMPSYSFLEPDEAVFMSKTGAVRTEFLNSIHRQKYEWTDESIQVPMTSRAVQRMVNDDAGKSLSKIQGIDAETLAVYFSTAKDKILAVADGICPVTRSEGKQFSVMQYNNSKVGANFTVKILSAGRISCDQHCPFFALHKVCPEVVAVAIKQDLLANYVEWFNKAYPSGPPAGLNNLVKTTLPSHAGSKAVGATTVRKGSNHRAPAVTHLVRPNPSRPSTSSIQKRPLEKGQTPGPSPLKAKKSGNLMADDETDVDASLFVLHPQLKKPSPMPGEFQFWFIADCPEQLSRCVQCRDLFRKPDVQPHAPFDAVIVAKMPRFYTRNGEQHSAQGNVYLHLSKSCLNGYLKKCGLPAFSQSVFFIGPVTVPKIKQSHKNALTALWR
ncbi:hypothetical protein BV898_17617 [Hypsibius exemplaris]|uniref:SWIM-type domain-containing protein n=1 Tax=Hypsibius exemplaris TaxID=2072580 RepID=A0A9X6NIA0_HYPEX|nr:hypothetical protein BV898_17617 [Hypsibius exemplaris]